MSSHYVQVFSNPRIAVTFLLMFASAFPLPLTSSGTTFQVWLKRNDVDIKTIGILTLVGLPYNLKFLWAPLLDRFAPPFLNRRTGWIAITQVLLIITIAAMGFLDPRVAGQMRGIVFAATLIAFFSASADIVIDAYRVDLLRDEERGAGAAIVQLASRVAFLGAGALALFLSDHLPWHQVFCLMAACLLVGLVTSLFAPAPERPVLPPKSMRDAVVEPFRNFFRREGAVEILLFVIFFKLGDTLAGALLSPFLVELGFTNTDIASVFKVFGMIAVIAGSLLAGALTVKIGVYRALWVFGILQAVSNFVFVGLAMAGKSYVWMVAAIGVENFCGGMGTVAFLAFLMGLCDRRFSATQYALLSSLMALARTVLSSGTGYMVAAMGWPKFFVVTAILALPGLVLLARIRRYQPA